MAKDIQKINEQIKSLDQKLKDQVAKVDQKLSSQISNFDQKLIDQIGNVNKKLKDQVSNLDQKLTKQVSTLDKKLQDQVASLENKINTQISSIENRITSLTEAIKELSNEMSIRNQQIKEEVDTQEEITRDMMQKFDEDYIKNKRAIDAEMEQLKQEQDVLKISYTVNDKQLIEKIEAMIFSEVRNACGDKENEILMKIWIKELKDILSDFEKFKKMHAKEFTVKIEEISNTIDVFKQKLVKG